MLYREASRARRHAHTHREEGTTRTVGYWWAVGMKRSPDSSLRPRLAASGRCRSCLEHHRVGQWLEETQEKELLDATPVKGWRERERRVGMEGGMGKEGWGDAWVPTKEVAQTWVHTNPFLLLPKDSLKEPWLVWHDLVWRLGKHQAIHGMQHVYFVKGSCLQHLRGLGGGGVEWLGVAW